MLIRKVNEMRHIKKFGHCFECKRLLPLKYLEQIEYYKDHIILGAGHHKLLCRACRKKAEEAFEDSLHKK